MKRLYAMAVWIVSLILAGPALAQDAPGTTKSADFDGDGRVGLDDFFLFAGVFGKTVTGDDVKYDLDGSGKVDFDDFFLFAGKFGR